MSQAAVCKTKDHEKQPLTPSGEVDVDMEESNAPSGANDVDMKESNGN